MATEVEDFLAHYGVKGVRWGTKRAAPGGGNTAGGLPKPGIGNTAGGLPSRKDLRGMNKPARARQRQEREEKAQANDSAIKSARASRKDTATAIKQAKREYKSDKKMVGKVVAREMLDKKREPLDEIMKKSAELTRGEEAAVAVLDIALRVAARSL